MVPQPARDLIQFRLSRGAANAWLESSKHDEIVLIVHGDLCRSKRVGNPELFVQDRIVEIAWHDADHRADSSVEPHLSTDYPRIGPEATPPEPIAQDHDVVPAWLVLLRPEH